MEHFFICPYCGEQISMVVDLSVRRQTYIEDCEVCCKPIEITCTVEDDSHRRLPRQDSGMISKARIQAATFLKS